MKISSNDSCPCHSSQKYKKCCQPYHKGILPSNALKLMRSRYCAYALGLDDYIMRSTHCNNVDFTDDTIVWRSNIQTFCHETTFNGLKILEFIDGDHTAFVTFEAFLNNQSFKEKSRFFKVNEKWFYESGEFLLP